MEGSAGQSTSGHDGKNFRHDGKACKESRNSRKEFQNGSITNCEKCEKIKQKINRLREHRKTNHMKNLVIVRRSNKVLQALNLPKVMNLNPRSAMNKIEEIKTFIEEEEIDCAFISESHDKRK